MEEQLRPDPLASIIFVLDRPRDVINVGAVVRLMGNFGLSRLRLVEPAAFDEGRILSVARRGSAVLAATERHPSLESALADCAFVLAATRRDRALHRPVLTPRLAAPALLAVAGNTTAEHRAAVLFGPEDFGLSNEALDTCHAILQIPALPHDASLNLAQAALLVAYELRLAVLAKDTEQPENLALPLSAVGGANRVATGIERDALFSAMEAMLWALHPTNIQGRVDSTMGRLRALLLRAIPRTDEAVLLTRLFQHIAHAVRPGAVNPLEEKEQE